MNLLLVKDQDFIAPNVVKIQGPRLQHILSVHRSKVGDSIRLGLINGLMGQGIISQLDEHQALIGVNLNQAPPPPLPVTVIMALPRPKMLRRILRFSAEIGVKKLYLINSYRVEKSFWQSPLLKAENMQAYLLQGLEQAKDTQLPEVILNTRFKPFVEDELGKIAQGTQALIAHPSAPSDPLELSEQSKPDDTLPCPHQSTRATTLVIGPEGGFIPYEVELIKQQGFQQISLGPRILRVENAYSVLIAKLFD